LWAVWAFFVHQASTWYFIQVKLIFLVILSEAKHALNVAEGNLHPAYRNQIDEVQGSSSDAELAAEEVKESQLAVLAQPVKARDKVGKRFRMRGQP
jgi:hypothetical protein